MKEGLVTLVFQLRNKTNRKKKKKQFPTMTFNERSPCLLSEKKTHGFVFLFLQMGGVEAEGGAVSHRRDSFQSD